MSNYTKTTNFATKDSLASGNPNKIVKGTEINSEFDNIATAVATKANTASPSLTGTVTAAALNVTGNLDVDGTLEFDSISGTGSVAVTDIADEDNMSSNSATKLATQQSIKAYVDSQVTAQDLDLTDGTTSISIDLDSEALSVLGSTGVTSTASGNGVTLAIDSTVTTLTGSQTLTNKTLTSPDVNTPDIDGGTIDGTVIGGATAAAGSFTTVGATGNITVGGTVDGRDVATDGTKLDGIEASATADQSNAEIRTAVEAASDSNVFTDADHSKLNAIEASADVTDTANVTAAGALMDSELTAIASVKALNQGVATGDSPTFVDVTATSLDISGNIDVDGVTNLDVVDIDGAVDMASTLQVDGAATFTTEITANGGIALGDNDKATFGAGDDLEIYHDGNNSYIKDGGTGDLRIWADSPNIATANGNKIFFGNNGAAELYFTGGNKRLATTTSGIEVTGTVTSTGTSVFASLDISGDIDVDGTTNLDVVDIDGAVAMATSLIVGGTSPRSGYIADFQGAGGNAVNIQTGDEASDISLSVGSLSTPDKFVITAGGSVTATGVVTANAGVVVDNITIDGNEIDVSSGDLTLDVAGDIILDADGADILLKDGGAHWFNLANSSGANLTSMVQDADILLRGNDGGSIITALTLDMSDGGEAYFSKNIHATSAFLTKTNNDANLTLITTDADATAGPLLVLDRQSASPADGDSIGTISFNGKNDAAEAHGYAKIEARIVDASNATEDGRLELMTSVATEEGISRILMNATETVINDNSKNLDFRVESDGNANMLFVDGGNNAVGIGTGSPNVALDVIGTTTSGIRLKSQESASNGFNIYNDSSSDTAHLNNHFNGSMIFSTNNTPRFQIAGDGSLSTPTAGTSNVRFGVNAGNSIASGGVFNVLIGDEAGTAITTGDNNVAVGYQALATEDANGMNVAIGRKALYTLNAGADAYNVAVGYLAGQLITTGVQNTLIGGLAGDSLNTGQENIALGYNALTLDTKGSHSVAIGSHALLQQNFSSATNSFNVAIGSSAGQQVTTGIQNTLIGGLAGDALTDADFNIAIGTYALTSDTLGSRSVAIGRSALGAQNFTSATNTYNVAVGHEAGQSVTTGTENTLIGGLAGDALTTGHYNVAVGFEALSTEDAHGRCTALGFRALKTLNAGTDSYNVAIGFDAGREVTTGIYNTLIGGLAGDALTDADRNVALGYGALGACQLGSRNTAVGFYALEVTNPSSAVNTQNTALGHSAGRHISTGTHNVCIGTDSGLATNLTTGSGNVVVGNFAHTSAYNSQYANGFGYDINAESGYTTLGKAADDIRAAHGNVTWATVSDERYKKDIVDSEAGLSFINALQPRTFKYKTLGELPETFSAYKADSTEVFKNSDTNHGFIAQEIKAAIDADSSIKDGFRLWDDRDDGSQEVAEAALIPILVKAIQELTARIETLEG